MHGTANPERGVARLLIAVALLVQFAPSIHLIGPHSHESSSCSHTEPRIHFEASQADGKESPCFVCTHLANRQAPVTATILVAEISITPASKIPPLATCPDPLDLQNPDNRGPPPPL